MTEHDATGTNGTADGEDTTGVDRDADSERDETETSTEDGSAGITEGAETFAALTERVAAASDEQVAHEISDLRELVSDLEARLDERDDTGTDAERVEELESKLARKQADFENFKKRMNRRREEERERATEDLVTRLLGVRDDLVRALDQDEDAEIRGGVESTLGELDRVLDDEGVSEIAPDPGSEIDPQRHEVMLRVDSEYPGETVADVFRPGYEMGGKVLRPAQVTVSDGGGDDENSNGDE